MIGPQNTALFVNLVPIVAFGVQIIRGYRPAALEVGGAALTVLALVAANLLSRRPRVRQLAVVRAVRGDELPKAA